MPNILQKIFTNRLSGFRIAFFLFVILSTLGIVWSVIPSPNMVEEYQSTPIYLNDAEWLAYHGRVVTIQPLTIRIEQPGSLRYGETDTLSLILSDSVDDALSGIHLSDLLDTYSMMWTTRLDLFGSISSPQVEISQPVEAGRSVKFRWELFVEEIGEADGTLWLYLRIFKPDGTEYAIPVMARPIKFQSMGIFGMTMATVRWIFILILATSFLILLVSGAIISRKA